MRHAVLLLVLAVMTSVRGDAILGNGNVILGFDDYGQLNVPYRSSTWLSPDLDPANIGKIGLRDGSGVYHATEAGAICEGWGASADSLWGGANNCKSRFGLSLVSFISSEAAGTATSIVTMGGALEITHDVSPSSQTPDLMRVHVTIRNIVGSEIAEVKYRRLMDWDIYPTLYSELVTVGGTTTTELLETSNDNGFCSMDPLAPCYPIISFTQDVDFEDAGPADHGAQFTFNFGSLAVDATIEFDIFYGASTSEANAQAAVGAVGGELYSFGQNSQPSGRSDGSPYTFIFAFRGVGGETVFDSSCKPVDEGCSMYASCEKDGASTNCTCLPGFQGDGVTCDNINECQLEMYTDTCHINADCDNTPGSFSCMCGPGYVGDGTECTGDSWGVRSVFKLDSAWTTPPKRRALDADDIATLRVIYGRLVSGDSALPQNSSIVTGMPVALGHLHYGDNLFGVSWAAADDEITLIALYKFKSDAEAAEAALLAEDMATYFDAIGDLLDGPKLYRWSLDPNQINPTGLTVDRVYFVPGCLDTGCWKVEVTYTAGIDNLNVFYLPKAEASDALSYNPSYDTVVSPWGISPLDTFLPSQHPCSPHDYQQDADLSKVPAQVTSSCIPGFLAMYRPVQTFPDAIDGMTGLSSALDTVCGEGLKDRAITRAETPIIAARGQSTAPANVFPKPLAPMITGMGADLFQAEASTIFVQGGFSGMPRSHINHTSTEDEYVGIYRATFTLDERELRTLAGQLRGTVGVEHTVDTFVGLAEFSPTGSTFLDPFVRQVNIHLEKTSFFSVSTHGTNEYTFLEYVNMRLVAIYNEDSDFSGASESTLDTVRTDSAGAAHYVQVTFTLGSKYGVNENSGLIPLDSVRAGKGTFFDDNDLAHKCLEWTNALDYTFADQAAFNTSLLQNCAPGATMCASPSSLPDNFVSFNIPLGIEFLPPASTSLSDNIFVDLVVSAVDMVARSSSSDPNAGEAPWQMKTTLTASIPVVDGGVNIFCDGITSKTDLQDVANVHIVVGSASDEAELSRLRIRENVASTQLDPETPTQIDSDSIESGLLTIVIAGNASYSAFGSAVSTLPGLSLELEDVITIHIMQSDDGRGENADVVGFVNGLITATGHDNSDTAGLITDGYALNDAFYFTIDRSSQRAHLEPSAALLARCPFNPTRPANAEIETCITRRDVRYRNYPARTGSVSSAMEICANLGSGQHENQGVNSGCVGSACCTTSVTSAESTFMSTIMGNSDFAKSLAVNFAATVADKYQLNQRFRRAYWINPGYEWTPTQTGGQSIFSISQKIFLFALITLDEGISTDTGNQFTPAGPVFSRRRMLLQSSDGLKDAQASAGGEVFEFETSPRSMMAKAFGVPEDRVATFAVQQQLTEEEALQNTLREGLEDYLYGSISLYHTIQVTSIKVNPGSVKCGTRRSGRSIRKLLDFSSATADVTMLVVFKAGAPAQINLGTLAQAPGVVSVTPLTVSPKIDTEVTGNVVTPAPSSESSVTSSSSDIALIAGVCGGVGGALAIALGAFMYLRRSKNSEVVHAVQTINIEALKSQIASEA